MSILWFSDEKRVPKVNDEIFSNLNIDKLLNYKTLSVYGLHNLETDYGFFSQAY